MRAGAECVVREGWGSGEARAATTGEAHELALKSAETDATKRALSTFGNPFGLALYDRELNGVRNRKALVPEMPNAWTLLSATGQPQQKCDSPKIFLAQLREAMSKAPTIEDLFAVWEQNLADRSADQQASQISIAQRHLCAGSRGPFAVVRGRSGRAARSFDGKRRSSHTKPKSTKACSRISEPKRMRSKEHLRFVASSLV